MKMNTFDDVFADEIKDLYSAENQLVKALPKMANRADSPELRKAFEHHLEQTRGHVERLEKIGREIGIKPSGKKCMGMEGLIEEGTDLLHAGGEPDPVYAALIGAAQRVEHYEIAAYGTAREHAEMLGHTDAAQLLEKTLEEEKDADNKLTSLAEGIMNAQAAMHRK